MKILESAIPCPPPARSCSLGRRVSFASGGANRTFAVNQKSRVCGTFSFFYKKSFSKLLIYGSELQQSIVTKIRSPVSSR